MRGDVDRKPQPLRILALDLSLTASGVCLDGETETIKTANLRGPERLRYIRDKVQALTPGVDLAAIEDYSFGSPQGACYQGELGGVIRVMLFERGIPYVTIPPTCRTKYMTGRGNAGKDDVLQQAVFRSGRCFGDNNQVDAWVLWCMAMEHYAPGHPQVPKMPALNLITLSKIAWPVIQP